MNAPGMIIWLRKSVRIYISFSLICMTFMCPMVHYPLEIDEVTFVSIYIYIYISLFGRFALSGHGNGHMALVCS